MKIINKAIIADKIHFPHLLTGFTGGTKLNIIYFNAAKCRSTISNRLANDFRVSNIKMQ